MIRALEKEDEPAKRDASPEREAAKFAAGDAVEARFGGKKKWYAGKILKVLDGARYEVEYDDGDVEKGVDEEMIRALAAPRRRRPRGRLRRRREGRVSLQGQEALLSRDHRGVRRWCLCY